MVSVDPLSASSKIENPNFDNLNLLFKATTTKKTVLSALFWAVSQSCPIFGDQIFFGGGTSFLHLLPRPFPRSG